ncbi:UDP-N-acetylglucosamine--N-acetylmuramyl-(pentapeptide) pyrophosphoryl-undecaprenol N-acetylglucosamine transferase [Calidithermus timidus]|jgi:UDP-N-acetylglucosamine--N-acetylmuramyl-(pentapeptide) pyrophosphoryl-undecaprenol N-acetylglucosamine transferase|uniref:UDP-N-acetylglucosamine--N-acetylmuramyl- (pentapeptide) pyrophosphoryl-undecaprenol N-acetylglucosamine transferase n=1 Tax=Calidithermus timidus TaxID=307124 RepID=UPI00035E5CCD|nr:UDP-N-acetylglucosamine--N-acetylmuramyl-(pentapeptide) pyrophosphoryl-undecaprenol N-acetylglucosamine transferase [Calidithermus timidus]
MSRPILVTGGGTGGHFYPGLAAAQALRSLGNEVAYVGAEEGLEARLLPQGELPYYLIPAGKLSREMLRPAEGGKVVRGLVSARRLLRRLKPRAVLSTVGYAGFPLAFAAEWAGVPVVIHEQNARLGLAARWLAAKAQRIGLSLPVALGEPLASRSRVVGYPVREIRHDKVEARRALGLDPARPLILVMGGSQGSLELNRELPSRLEPFVGEYQVLHQCGLRWEAQMQAEHARAAGYVVRGFVDGPLAWSAADFAITRAGAGTLAEAAYHQVPSLLVPLPAELDGGAQQANARFYAQRGASVILEGWERFQAKLEQLFTQATAMRSALAQLSPAGAACRLAELVLEVAR